MEAKKKVKKVGVAPGIHRVRAIVRPLTIIYSVFILSILAIMAMSGYSMPVEGVGANCVNALIGITGVNAVEYSFERGIRHIIERKKNGN